MPGMLLPETQRGIGLPDSDEDFRGALPGRREESGLRKEAPEPVLAGITGRSGWGSRLTRARFCPDNGGHLKEEGISVAGE